MTTSFHFKASVLAASLSYVHFAQAAEVEAVINSNQSVTQLQTIIVTATENTQEQAQNNYTVSQSSSATKLDLKLKETPQSMTVFTEKQMQDQDIRDVNEVLVNTPGVSTSNFGIPGTGAYRMMARGFDIDNFTVDGVPINLEVLGGTSGAAIQDSFLYERVDVIRGSTGLATGFGNPTASVNFIRKRPYKDENRGQVNLKVGSWNNIRQELDYSTLFTESGDWRGRVAFTNESGDYHIDRASQNGFSLYGITELDVGNHMFTLGASHQYKRFDELAPQGIMGKSKVYDSRLPSSDSFNYSDYGLSNRFNNATDWTYNWYKMTNVFAGWKHTFENDWQINANYNYAHNQNDSRYGVLGTENYAPAPYDMASYIVGRDGFKNDIHSLDLHLKGIFDFYGREQNFVIGLDGYDSQKTELFYGRSSGNGLQYWDYNNDGINDWLLNQGSGVISLKNWNNGHTINPIYQYGDIDGSRVISMNENKGQTELKRQEWGAYFALQLRPIDRLQAIIGGRYSQLKYNNTYKTFYGKALAWGDESAQANIDLHGPTYTANFIWGDPNPKGYVPYYGLIFEATPEINLFASYTGIMRTNHFTLIGGIMENGEYLPPIKGDTIEAGIKGGFFNDRLNLGLSYFQMEQKNAPEPGANMQWGVNWPITLPNGQASSIMVPGGGYKVYGVELNLAGEITPTWRINAGYVWQDKKFPMANASDIPMEYFSNDWDTFTELRYNEFILPEHQFKIFTSYDWNDKLTIGGGLNWQSKVRAYDKNSVYSLNSINVFDVELEQDAYFLASAMARYKVNSNMSLGINIDNLFDETYYTNRNGSFYGTPRNYTASINYKF